MKSESKKSAAGKIARFAIVVLVLVGAAAIMGVSHRTKKHEARYYLYHDHCADIVP